MAIHVKALDKYSKDWDALASRGIPEDKIDKYLGLATVQSRCRKGQFGKAPENVYLLAVWLYEWDYTRKKVIKYAEEKKNLSRSTIFKSHKATQY